nr:hypothetical protein [Tanacetum cinerariifolium]
MDQDRQILMVKDNVGNQFRPNAVQNVGNQIAQEEEAWIQSTQEEFKFMAATDASKETERVKANCILKNNLQQALTSGTQSDKATVYDSNGSAETFNSQQSSPKLDAAYAIKFLELNALRSQQSSLKLDAASAIKFLGLSVFFLQALEQHGLFFELELFFIKASHQALIPLVENSKIGSSALLDKVIAYYSQLLYHLQIRVDQSRINLSWEKGRDQQQEEEQHFNMSLTDINASLNLNNLHQ